MLILNRTAGGIIVKMTDGKAYSWLKQLLMCCLNSTSNKMQHIFFVASNIWQAEAMKC